MSVPVDQHVNKNGYRSDRFNDHIVHRVDKTYIQISLDSD
jgi:hypothetical protein